MLDVTEKRLAYAERGIASYWLVDPDERLLTVLRLERGAYQQVVTVGPDDAADLSQPFTLTIRGRDLLL